MLTQNSVFVSTKDVPTQLAKDYWEREVNKYVIRVDCPTIHPDGVQASLRHDDLDLLRVNHISATAHSVQRSRFDIAYDSRASVFMCLMLKGNGYSYQGNACSNHRPGDLIMYDTMKPYGHGFPANMEMIVVDIPRNIANEIIGKRSIDDLIKIDSHVQFGKSSNEAIFKLLQKTPSSTSEMHSICNQVIHHTEVLFNSSYTKSSQKSGSILYNECKAYIDTNLTDTELSIDNLCNELHTSPRQLARAFARSEQTVSRYIWDSRLEKSREDILNSINMNITEIAFKWGFNHSTHFSSAYKKYYGESPSNTRRVLKQHS
jgi:AraC-like DNA-binding protein